MTVLYIYIYIYIYIYTCFTNFGVASSVFYNDEVTTKVVATKQYVFKKSFMKNKFENIYSFIWL